MTLEDDLTPKLKTFDPDSVAVGRAQTDSETLQNIRGVIDAVLESDNLEPGGMRMRMVAKKRLLRPLVRLHLYAYKFQSPTAAAIARYIEEVTVGEEGRGRTDMVESLKAIIGGMQNNEQEQQRRSIMSRLLGIGR
jgi:hypothetical protein